MLRQPDENSREEMLSRPRGFVELKKTSRVAPPSGRCLWPILWSCLIIIGSVVPFKFRHDGLQNEFHRASHIIAFLTTVVIFFGCARTAKSRFAYFGLAIFLALATELLEMMVYHSVFEWEDVMFDLAGVVIGLLLVAAGRNLRRTAQS